MFGKMVSALLFGSSPNISLSSPNFHWSFSPLSGHPIHAILLKKIHLKILSWKWRPFCLRLNVLIHHQRYCYCSWCVLCFEYDFYAPFLWLRVWSLITLLEVGCHVLCLISHKSNLSLQAFKLKRAQNIKSNTVITRLIQHDITYCTLMTAAKHKSDFKLTTDTPYLALTGELWGVCGEEFWENWLRYNGTALYITFNVIE